MKNTTRLLLAIFLTTYVSIVAFTIAAYYFGQHGQTAFIKDRVVNVNQLKAKKINGFYGAVKVSVASAMKQDTVRKNLVTLSASDSTATQRATAQAALHTYFEEHFDEIQLEEVVGVRTDKGVFYAYGDESPKETGQKIPSYLEPLFSQGQLQNDTGQIFSDPKGHISFGVGQPLFDTDGYPVGVVIFHYEFQSYVDAVAEDTGLSVTGETYIIELEDHDSLVYLSPLRTNLQAALVQRISAQDSKASISLSAIRGPSGSGFGTDYTGKRVIAAWDPLSVPNWGIVTKIDASEGLLTLEKVRWSLIILLTTLAVLLFVGISLAVKHYVHRPLLSLERVAQEIEHDHYEAAKIDQRMLYASDEFGAIATALHNIIEHHKNHSHSSSDKPS